MLQVITHCTDPNYLLCSVYLLFLDVCSDLRDGKTPIWGREWDDLMQSLFSRLSQIAILDPLDQLPKIIWKICAGFSWMLHGDVEAIPHRLGGDRGSSACFLDFASVIFVIEYVVVEEHRNPRPHGQGNPGFAGAELILSRIMTFWDSVQRARNPNYK